MKNTLKMAVLGCTALSMVMATSANAAVTLISTTPAADPAELTSLNLATAQTQCDAAAALLDTDGSSQDSNIYSAEVVEGAVTVFSGPTEVGTHTFAANGYGTQVGAGTFTPAHKEILGDPYRNGGSVNMFGIVQTVGGHYSNSSYDFTNNFTTVYAHAYTCTISVEVFHPAVHHYAEGVYEIYGEHGSSESAVRGNCAAFSQHGPPAIPVPDVDWWGEPFHGGNIDPTSNGYGPHCQFVGSPAGDDPAFHDPATVVATGVPGGSFNQSQTDSLNAHESFGEGFDTSATLIIGQAVVCISPSKSGTKLPGAWAKQNGYTGDKCTTAWYNGGATVGVPNLNDGSHNFVTVPVV